MSTFSLKIISTDKVFYEGKCEYLVIPTIDGEKGILAHHENMVIAVEIGELRFRKPDGEWVTAVVSKGFAEIVNNRASVLVNTAERPEDIDVKRAEEAKERAEHLLVSTDKSIEEIADSVGYHNKGYFYKLFQEKYEETPASYRRHTR